MMKRSKMASGKIAVQVSVVTRMDDAVDWLYGKDTTNREREKSGRPVNGVKNV
jgi:hypothetical protein